MAAFIAPYNYGELQFLEEKGHSMWERNQYQAGDY